MIGIYRDCNTAFADAIISDFNYCDKQKLLSIFQILGMIIFIYIIINFLLRILNTKAPITQLLTTNRSRIVIVSCLLWCCAMLFYLVLNQARTLPFNIRGVAYIFVGYMMPYALYIQICKNESQIPVKILYLLVSACASIVFLSKLYLLYYISFLGVNSLRTRNFSKKLVSGIYLFLLGIIFYVFVQFMRSYTSGFELNINSATHAVYKILSRILIIDQLLWCLNLIGSQNPPLGSFNTTVSSLINLQQASYVKLLQLGYVEGFAFSLSAFGPAYVIHGLLGVALVTLLIYFYVYFICRLSKLSDKSFVMFPVALQIINNGFNFHTIILMISVLIVSLVTTKRRRT